MRFFIIPKKMFKNREDKEKTGETALKNKRKIIIAAAISTVVILVGLVVYAVNRVPSRSYVEGVGEISLAASTSEERAAFFAQFGYKVQQVHTQEITIPCASSQFEEYNDLQKSQGFDLMPYCSEKADMYTMKILGEDAENELFGVIIVYKGKVVAGHITDNLYPACVMPLTQG